ncbi:four helix bundle protein [Planctellipticum variicoloris]|uniref:four helix bundle protein n=1 Tax=Planctellipticum variicoloris TaxID=3064265 RepID=UPI003AF66F0F
MARTQFESLQIYRLAESLSDAVWTIAREWPEFDRRTAGLQLVRAADSVGANIAEGSGRGTFADNRRFVRMARGSLYECKHWLRRAWNRQLLKADEVDQLKTIVDELGPKLNAYLNSIGKTGSRAVPQGRRFSNPQEDAQSPSSNH